MSVANAPYEPSPGTIAYRALHHLQRDGAPAEVTASMWAEAVGIQPANLAACVEPLIRHKRVERFTKHGQTRPAWYRLATAQQPQGETMDATNGASTPAKWERAARSIANGEDHAEPPRANGADHTAPSKGAVVFSVPEGLKPEDMEFRCARWDDGSLMVLKDGKPITFSKQEALRIVSLYLSAATIQKAA